jgi:hypothetical protein
MPFQEEGRNSCRKMGARETLSQSVSHNVKKRLQAASHAVILLQDVWHRKQNSFSRFAI